MCVDCEPKELGDVRRFHRQFGLVRRTRPSLPAPHDPEYAQLSARYAFLCEELDEFRDAALSDNPDLGGIADALVDLVYVALGTAVILGLPWEDLWNDVQRANLAKVRATGQGKDDHHGSIAKPPGWIGPHTWDILVAAGYDGDPTPSWPAAPEEEDE